MSLATVLPIRMNLVDVELNQLRLNHTHIDAHYKQVSGVASWKKIKLKAQNYRQVADAKVQTRTGDETRTFGRLVFKKKYLDDLDIEIKKGDKVTKIIDEEVNYEIIEVRQESALDGAQLLTFAIYGTMLKERSSE